LGQGSLRLWRIDDQRHASSWNSGEGAYRVGGRWNSRGLRAVYAALDPATAILEVAVHKGFKALDTVRHVLSSARVVDPAQVHVLDPAMVPNPNWLVPGAHGPGQQAFGDDLLRRYGMILIPSTVSRHSWNLIFDAATAQDRYDDVTQEDFALDPRLHV
jgi:RES domain-containing protein